MFFLSVGKGNSDTYQANRTEKIYGAKNGQEALKFIFRYRPDIMLLDVQMPMLNGIEAMQAGITLIDYLNAVRIDHACVYLEQNFSKLMRSLTRWDSGMKSTFPRYSARSWRCLRRNIKRGVNMDTRNP